MQRMIGRGTKSPQGNMHSRPELHTCTVGIQYKPLLRSEGWNVIGSTSTAGADPGGSLGSDEPPSERKNFFETILVRRGAEFGEVNRVVWHENGGWDSRDRFRGVEFKTDMCI